MQSRRRPRREAQALLRAVGFPIARAITTALVATLGIALGIAPASCEYDDGRPRPYAFDPPPIRCTVPPLPEPPPNGVVVGDGSAASCTEAALREAVAQGGHVTFDCGGSAGAPVTLPLSAEITVTADTLLDGGGRVTLDGGGATRLIATEAHVALVVHGLRFVHGNARGADPGSGGAIRLGWRSRLQVFDCVFEDNEAALEGIEGGGAIYQASGGETTIVRSVFRRNRAISGGAIDNLLSPLTVVDSTFLYNEATGGGGALYTDGGSEYIDDEQGGTISLCGCHFGQNESVGTGGAVYLWAYPRDLLLINHCRFVGNVTRRGEGSALGGAMRTGNAPCLIANSLFAENHADVHGGAYWTRGHYNTRVENSTFYRNVAGVPGQEGGYGGALSGFNTQVRGCTFVENHAEFTGGALSAEGDQWTLENSILLHNTAANEWGLSQSCTATLPGAGVLQWPAARGDGDPPCVADATFADPRLGELGDHGGRTRTIPLLSQSPALDAGDDCLPTDQRGEPRHGPCDLGAYEAQPQ